MSSPLPEKVLLAGKPLPLAFLHVFCLFTLAIAHPVYTSLGQQEHEPFFIAHQSQPSDLWLLILLLSFLLPGLACLCLWLIGRLSERLANWILLVLLFVLLTLAILPMSARMIPGQVGWTVTLAVIVAAWITVTYPGTRWLGTFLTFMSLGVFVAPVLFVSSASFNSVVAQSKPHDQGLFADRGRLPDIVLMVFDELPLVSLLDREHRVDAINYPNFHRLASTSTWYRNTTTVNLSTGKAIKAILSGADGTDEQTLFSLLSPDYEIRAIELVTKLAPENPDSGRYLPPLNERFPALVEDTAIFYAHTVTPVPARAWLPQVEGQWQGFAAGPDRAIEVTEWPYRDSFKRLSIFRQFVDSLEKNSAPTVFFLHTLLPHYPYVYNPSGQFHENRFKFLTMHFRETTGSNNYPDETSARLVYQAHLMQLEFVDKLLGRILDRLVEQDLFDDSIIILVSDHGASFYWDSEGLDTEEMRETQAAGSLYVPLFMKAPGQKEGQISDVPREIADIVPLLFDLLNGTAGQQGTRNHAPAPMPDSRERQAFVPEKILFENFSAGLERALNYKLGLAGNGQNVMVGMQHPQLAGRQIASFERSRVDARSVIENLDAFRNMRQGQVTMPAYINGRITNPSPEQWQTGIDLGIAVNGAICATTKTSKLALQRLGPEGRRPSWLNDPGGEARKGTSPAKTGDFFMAYLPPGCFAADSNEIEVFGLLPDSGETGWKLLDFTPSSNP